MLENVSICMDVSTQISREINATSTKVTLPDGNKYWSCNVAAVLGQMATGEVIISWKNH